MELQLIPFSCPISAVGVDGGGRIPTIFTLFRCERSSCVLIPHFG
jgi:hypothetical protein